MTRAHRTYFNGLAPQWGTKDNRDQALPIFLERFGVTPGDRVLDLGCGTGRATQILREMVAPGGHVFAVDLAEEMLKQGRPRLRSRAVSWLCADGHHCPIRDGRLDKVLILSAFPHFASPDCLISEMRRVLRPGGRLLVLHTHDHATLNAFHGELGEPVSGDTLPPAPVLAAWLVQAGFHTLAVEEEPGHYWVEARTP